MCGYQEGDNRTATYGAVAPYVANQTRWSQKNTYEHHQHQAQITHSPPISVNMSSRYAPRTIVEAKNRRVTFVVFRLLAWLINQQKVNRTKVMAFMIDGKSCGGETDADEILRMMNRLTLIDTSRRGRMVFYYVTDYGAALLQGYKERPPLEYFELPEDIESNGKDGHHDE